MGFQQTLTDAVCEGTTAQLVMTLTDENGATVTLGVSTLTLTLYDASSFDPSSPVYINSRNGQDILNTNGGTLTAGVLTLVLGYLDNVLTSQSKASEDHIALIQYTWSSGTKKGKKEITYTVVNQAAV